MDANTEYVENVCTKLQCYAIGNVFCCVCLETVSITSVTTESLIVGWNEAKEEGAKLSLIHI